MFRQQNAVGCELLFSLRWRDRLLFANASWFVNKFLTTFIQINQPSFRHMALLSVIFSISIWKAITHSTEKPCWFKPPTMLIWGQGKISKLWDKLLLGNNEKKLLTWAIEFYKTWMYKISIAFKPSLFLSCVSRNLFLVCQSTLCYTLCSHWVILFPYLCRQQPLALISCLVQRLILLWLVPVNTLKCFRIRRLWTKWKNKQLFTQIHL